MHLVFSTESLHKLLSDFGLILALFNPEKNFTPIQEPDVIFSNLSNGQNRVLLLHCYIMVPCYTLQLAGPALLRPTGWMVRCFAIHSSVLGLHRCARLNSKVRCFATRCCSNLGPTLGRWNCNVRSV